MRLTFGRRLTLLIVGLLIGALILATIGFSVRSRAAEERALQALEGATAPLAELIAHDLERAGRKLEFEAAVSVESGTPRMLERIELAGFLGSEIVADETSASSLQASSNFLQRVAEETSIGPTRTVGSDVSVLIGTRLPNDAPDPGLLLALHDADPLISALVSARIGDSGEILAAVRNSNGALVLFTPSRHNNDRTLGAPGPQVDELLSEALAIETHIEEANLAFDDRNVLAVAQRVPGSEWVLLATVDRDDAGIDLVPGWLPWAFAALGLLAAWPAWNLRRRLKDVLRGAQQLARGQDVHGVEDSANDEISEMATALEGLSLIHI